MSGGVSHSSEATSSRAGLTEWGGPSSFALPFQPGRGLHPSYRFTFADFDGSLQYASAIPPARECTSDGAADGEGPGEGCPLLLSTHGASVDAASPFWTNVYQQQERAWTLLPTNRGGFGYDWQGAGLRNAQAAWAALARDLPGVPEAAKARYVLSGAVLYSGHSMGGHGCLILATHFPEGELASACTAGWIKAALYPPEFLSPAASLGDVHLNAVLRAATSEYDTDFALPNLRDLPMLVRMGAEDEDVPMLNLLRIARLKAQLERNGTAGAAVQVSEVPGKPHWWPGVVDDAEMQAFLAAHLYTPVPRPARFTLRGTNPATLGSRAGLSLLQVSARSHRRRAGARTWPLRRRAERNVPSPSRHP